MSKTFGCILRKSKIADDSFCASPITFVPWSFSAEPMVDNSKASSMTIRTRSLIPLSYAQLLLIDMKQEHK